MMGFIVLTGLLATPFCGWIFIQQLYPGWERVYFLIETMLKEKVTALLEAALKENESLFLLDFSISPDHKIKIVLDGDQGVSLQDCMNVSRAIEHNLDREEEDFSLEV